MQYTSTIVPCEMRPSDFECMKHFQSLDWGTCLVENYIFLQDMRIVVYLLLVRCPHRDQCICNQQVCYTAQPLSKLNCSNTHAGMVER